jgi:hypothetical protein
MILDQPFSLYIVDMQQEFLDSIQYPGLESYIDNLVIPLTRNEKLESIKRSLISDREDSVKRILDNILKSLEQDNARLKIGYYLSGFKETEVESLRNLLEMYGYIVSYDEEVKKMEIAVLE